LPDERNHFKIGSFIRVYAHEKVQFDFFDKLIASRFAYQTDPPGEPEEEGKKIDFSSPFPIVRRGGNERSAIMHDFSLHLNCLNS